MVRRPKEVPVVQAHHEWNQPLTVRPELVEGLIQRLLNSNNQSHFVINISAFFDKLFRFLYHSYR